MQADKLNDESAGNGERGVARAGHTDRVITQPPDDGHWFDVLERLRRLG